MRLIGLMTVRNEAWCLRASITTAMRWCDGLVVLDHASSDETPQIISDSEKEYPNRITRMVEPDGEWAEMSHRQMALEKAREIGATHCAIIDADEFMSMNYITIIREWIAELRPAQLLRIPLLSCWRSLDNYRMDPHPLSWAMASLAFQDRPHLHWKTTDDGYQWHHRHPYGSNSKDLGEHRTGRVLHIQHANWRRLIAKQALYVARETVKWGAVRANYAGTVNEDGLELHPVPEHWWGPEKSLIDLTAEPWQESELRNIVLAQPNKFYGVDLFGARDGAMLKVISYCMFGKFYGTLPMILRAHHSVYPSWGIWLHHDVKVTEHPYWKVAERLNDLGLLKLVQVNDAPQYTRAMLWRMKPIWAGPHYVFCRDLDSLPMPKERKCMEEFISSSLSAHGINDNVVHGVPLMGGMCGFKSVDFLKLTRLESYEHMLSCRGGNEWATHGTDQELLSYLWFEHLHHHAMLHRIYRGATEVAEYHGCAATILRPGPDPLSDVDPEVVARGDSFINYIGAAGCNIPQEQIIEFFDRHANDAVRTIIREEQNARVHS